MFEGTLVEEFYEASLHHSHDSEDFLEVALDVAYPHPRKYPWQVVLALPHAKFSRAEAACRLLELARLRGLEPDDKMSRTLSHWYQVMTPCKASTYIPVNQFPPPDEDWVMP